VLSEVLLTVVLPMIVT